MQERSTLSIDIISGVTTFLTMSYIVAVNPAILATEGTGMSFLGVMTATVLISFFSTLLMGLVGRLPFGLAPGMGINAFFAYSLVLGKQIPWDVALGIIFWSGVLFLVASIIPLREKIAESIPPHLRQAMGVGIGLFLALIGLKAAGFVVDHPATLITFGGLSKSVGITVFSFIAIAFLHQRKNPFAYIVGIGIATAAAIIVGDVSTPKSFLSQPDFGSTFFKLDIMGALKLEYMAPILLFFFTDMFDSLSTFLGVSTANDMLDENGKPKNLKRGLLVDAIATFFSSLFGTSSATTYIESSAGIELGGRTGRSAVVTALCFLPCLFIGPIVQMIPSYGTASVLIFIGALMFSNIRSIEWGGLERTIPAFLVVVLIPLTFSITQGLLWGVLAHTTLHILVGKYKELELPIWFLSACCLGLLFVH